MTKRAATIGCCLKYIMIRKHRIIGCASDLPRWTVLENSPIAMICLISCIPSALLAGFRSFNNFLYINMIFLSGKRDLFSIFDDE